MNFILHVNLMAIHYFVPHQVSYFGSDPTKFWVGSMSIPGQKPLLAMVNFKQLEFYEKYSIDKSSFYNEIK